MTKSMRATASGLLRLWSVARQWTGSVSSASLSVAAAALAIPLAVEAPALAQDSKMIPIATPPQRDAVILRTGPLPGAKAPEAWHSQYGSRFARNVTVATLTPFLPDPRKANGTAVVVAPGGGFRTLSMENEGWDVARALADRGVAAFVLKYRLNQTPADMAAFERSMAAMVSSAGRPRPLVEAENPYRGLAPQVADSRAAFALIRSRAKEWRIDPAQIGMVGFSAGAMLTMATALAGQDAKPAFIANIYGPLTRVTVPVDAPPLFVALAADDPLLAGSGIGLIESWQAAKRPVEFHLYERGGHGFGMYRKDTTSTGWFEAFVRWMEMHRMLKPSP